MSLDLRVRTAKGQLLQSPWVTLEDDGYYWFLQPFFARVSAECGKYIDLYGDALFTHDDFPRLRRMLDDADALARRERTKIFQVHVGTQVHPGVKELFRPVERARLLSLIAELRSSVAAAEECGGVIQCLGD